MILHRLKLFSECHLKHVIAVAEGNTDLYTLSCSECGRLIEEEAPYDSIKNIIVETIDTKGMEKYYVAKH